MSAPPKPKRAALDAQRIAAARAKLDELVTAHPRLTSKESQERLARQLDDDNEHDKDGDDGTEETDDG